MKTFFHFFFKVHTNPTRKKGKILVDFFFGKHTIHLEIFCFDIRADSSRLQTALLPYDHAKLTGETFSFDYVYLVLYLLAVFCLMMDHEQIRSASHQLNCLHVVVVV